MRRRRDVGLGVEQLVEPLRRAGGAQQVAIDFGQRAECAGEQTAVEHERGDRAAGHRARGDVDRALPNDSVIALNIRKMTMAVITARSRMRRLAVANTRFDGLGEAAGLARLLAECLDDLHRAEHFAVTAPTSAMRSWLRRRNRADLAAEER